MTWILLVVGVLHAVGIGWGLPGSDGWDTDGVAPRDFLPGLASTFTPGQYYTYPPLHLAILAILTLPITLVAVVRAPSLSLHDIIGEIIHVPYMTAMSTVARLVSLAMSLGIVLAIARVAEEMRAHELALPPPSKNEGWSDARVRRIGWCTAAFVGVNAALTYYGKTTNLDVPYLFWAALSILAFVRAVSRREPKRFRSAFILAALSVGTKDQAYAMFALSLPTAVVVWMSVDGWARSRIAPIARDVALATGMAVAALLFVDGAIVNPTGFRARIAFLTGSASQDFAEYSRDWSGRLAILRDAARLFVLQFPHVLAIPIAIGLGRAIAAYRGQSSERRNAGLVVALFPLLVAVSFTVTFNWAARRTNARFLVPQAVMLAIYGGYGLDAVVFASRRWLRIAGQALASLAMAFAIFRCIAVDVNLARDPRYDVEKWLAEHVAPGDTIECYGLNVYQPRFPSQAHVIRVGPEPLDKRNPLPDVEEVRAPFDGAKDRGSKWVVLSVGWVWRYFEKPDAALSRGHVLAAGTHQAAADAAASRYFDDLLANRAGFFLVYDAKYDPSIFPNVDIHGTSARLIWVFRRIEP